MKELEQLRESKKALEQQRGEFLTDYDDNLIEYPELKSKWDELTEEIQKIDSRIENLENSQKKTFKALYQAKNHPHRMLNPYETEIWALDKAEAKAFFSKFYPAAKLLSLQRIK